MTKELNFNKAEIEYNNNTFCQWMEEMKGGNGKTWYANFMRGGNKIYVGVISGKSHFRFAFPDKDFATSRRRLKFNNLRTAIDDIQRTPFDEAMFKDCYRLAYSLYAEDSGLVRRVKEQGR